MPGNGALRDEAAELVARTRKAQGLPVVVDDPATLAQIAAILSGSSVEPLGARAS